MEKLPPRGLRRGGYVAGRWRSPVELSAFRIVQEALTNVLRHAGPGARAAVELAFAEDHLDLAVVDTGQGCPDTQVTMGGHGLLGIRERVAVSGGSVTAGPAPDGGFGPRAALVRVGQS